MPENQVGLRRQARPHGVRADDAQARCLHISRELARTRRALLGEITADLAAADQSPLVGSLQEYLGFVRADVVERLQNQFELLPDAPVYWQADVREIVRNNGSALLRQNSPRLADWPEDFDAGACAEAARSELLDMAQAWRDWPALWNAAREQGDRLISGL